MTSENIQATYAWLKEQGFMVEAKQIRILSIDAWRYGNGWTWNEWWEVGKIDDSMLATLKTPREILRYMRERGFLSSRSGGKCEIDDDGYNVVICERSTHMPIFAIAYGEGES